MRRACAALARETYGLASRLGAADLDVVGMLTPRLMAQTIRVSFDPQSQSSIAMANVTGDGQDMEKLNASAFQPPNGFNVGWYKNDQVEQLRSEYLENPAPSNTQFGWVWV